MIEVSIIIPVYNGQEHIQECLESLVKQTYSKVQIIIVNDGSTDNTQKILDKYNEKYQNIIVISEVVNQGVSTARNTAIDIAKGEYILFVDADDKIPNPKAIKTLVNCLQENDRPDIVQFRSIGDKIDYSYLSKQILLDDKIFSRLIISESINTLWNKI